MAKKMKTIFAITILLFICVAGTTPLETNSDDREMKESESLQELQGIADLFRSDATDQQTELFDTPYDDKINDPDFDIDLAERFDATAYHDDLNDPVHGEQDEEGEAEDEEWFEDYGSGVNPKPSRPPIRSCIIRCCRASRRKRFCVRLCRRFPGRFCPKRGRGGRGRGRPRDVPQVAHFIENESTGPY